MELLLLRVALEGLVILVILALTATIAIRTIKHYRSLPPSQDDALAHFDEYLKLHEQMRDK